MPQLKQVFRRSPRKIGLVMLLLSLASLLAGCATSSIEAAPDISLACHTYGKGLTYDTTKDTAETIRQEKVKNNAFKNAGCDLTQGGVAKK